MLQTFLREKKIRSVVDFGCGDWQFSQFIDWTGIDYRGFDIVPSVVESNRERFQSSNIRFDHVEDGTALPSADLLICKDVLQHLPTADIQRNLKIFKTLFPHLLVTNDIAPSEGVNTDIDPGQWRPLRLDRPPFNEPVEIMLEWDIEAYNCHWTKQACHIRTRASSRPAAIELRDEKRGSAETLASSWRAAKSRLLSTPLLGSAAKAMRRLLPPR